MSKVPKAEMQRCPCRRLCTCDDADVDRMPTSLSLKARTRPGTVCALCTRTIIQGHGIAAPLGASDADVTICSSCNDGQMLMRPGPERGFEPGGSVLGGLGSRVAKARDRIIGNRDGHQEAKREIGIYSPRTPGWILVRIDRRLGSKHLADLRKRGKHVGEKIASRDEVERPLRDKPWFAESRYIGAKGNWILFEHPEHPDPKVIAKIREEGDPLAAISVRQAIATK